ncbi:MAG: DUF1850 domain-containing protein [Halodesulfurarchaeum sp.]
MAPSARSIRVGFVVVLLVALVGLSGAASTETVLVVQRADSGETIIEQPVENGSTIALEYTHSVEQSRVLEEYTVRGAQLEMTWMEFESYGWGLPTSADVREENGTFVYDPPGIYDEVRVAPGSVADHELQVHGEHYDLVNRSGANPVTMRVETRSPLSQLLDGIPDERN